MPTEEEEINPHSSQNQSSDIIAFRMTQVERKMDDIKNKFHNIEDTIARNHVTTEEMIRSFVEIKTIVTIIKNCTEKFDSTVQTLIDKIQNQENRADEKYAVKATEQWEEKADKKYAFKIIQRIVFSVIAMVGAAVIGAILALIIKPFVL